MSCPKVVLPATAAAGAAAALMAAAAAAECRCVCAENLSSHSNNSSGIVAYVQ